MIVEAMEMAGETMDRATAELLHLFNDPEAEIEPERIWSLLAEASRAGRALEAA